MGRMKLLRVCGRFSVTSATAPRASYNTVASSMGVSWVDARQL
jgi:hypothetical protein